MSSKFKTRNPQQHLPAEIADAPLSAALPLSTELLPKPARGFYNSQHQSLRLSQKIGTGGEGSVFEIHGQPDIVVKIYHQPPSADKAEKLLALSRLSNDRLSKLSAWPLDVVRDYPDGQIIGFVMKKFAQAEEVHALHSPKSRLQKFPEASWAFLVYAAANVARATALMHEHGFVIGDLNPKNILVTRQATVHLLDCDSFQVTADGKQYRCEGGFPEYTPPELQGVAFREIDRQPQHDGFGLAVVIFQLLFMGRHPFSGRYQGTGEMPLERAISEFRFAYGEDAVARQMQQPPGTLQMKALPASLIELFRRAFITTERPAAHEWIAPLETLAKSLKKCALHSGHNYYQELDECPWCQIESRARIRLFNFLTPGEKQNIFRLNEIWKEINRINPPEPSHLTLNAPVPEITPSPQIVTLEKEQTRMMILTLVISLIAGISVALVGRASATTISFLLFIMLPVIKKIAENLLANPVRRGQRFFADGRARDDFYKNIESSREQARIQLDKLSSQWNKEASEEQFINQFNYLQKQKEEYQQLAATRQKQLQELEASVRESQLEEYLEKFEVRTADIPGIGSTTKTFLLSYNIETAADIKEPRLRAIRGVGDGRAEKLLAWRKSLEQKFVFDPHTGVPPQARIRVEQKIDELRGRMERDLSNGPFYLRKTQQEIETARSHLIPALTQARESLAQAEKDREIISRKKSTKAASALLIISCFLTLMVKGIWVNSDQSPNDGVPLTAVSSGPVGTVTTEETRKEYPAEYLVSESSQRLYLEGVRLSREKKFLRAVRVLEQAVREDAGHSGAHTELGYAYYRLGKYDQAIGAALQTPSLNSSFSAQYTLGLSYSAQEKWDEATEALIRAVNLSGMAGWEESYTTTYDLLAQAQIRRGTGDDLIAWLVNKIEKNADAPSTDHLYLGALYLHAEYPAFAYAQYEVLKEKNSPLANELQKLIRQHSGKKIIRKN